MVILKSESANKTQQNNAKILFGTKGVSVLAKLEMYSKEKALATEGINALLEVLKTKDATLLEKFANSKTGKTLTKNCKQLASAKSFDAIMKNIKQIKPLKSFDKFTAAPAKSVKNTAGDRVGIFTEADLDAAIKQNQTKTNPNPSAVGIPNVSDLDYALLNMDIKGESKKVGDYLGQILKIPTNLIKTGSMVDSPKGEGYSVLLKSGAEAFIFESKTAPSIRKMLGVRKRFFFYIDDHATGGPIQGDPSPISGTLIADSNFESLVAAIRAREFSYSTMSGATGNFKGDLFSIDAIQPLLKTVKGVSKIEDFFQSRNKHSGLEFVVQRQVGNTEGFFLQAIPSDSIMTGEELPEVHSVVLGGIRRGKKAWNPDAMLVTKTVHKNGKFVNASQYTSLKKAVNAMVIANKKVFRKLK